MRIAVINTKGGVGKTTTCVYLATAMARTGENPIVLDADPQGSATVWVDIAERGGQALSWETQTVNLHQLRKLTDEPAGSRPVLIDGPPGNPEIINAVVRAADFVIIPSKPALLDMQRVWTTMDNLGDVPAAVLLTETRYGTRLFEEAQEALDDAEVPTFDTTIPLREDIRASLGTQPAKLHGYDEVLAEIKDVLDA